MPTIYHPIQPNAPRKAVRGSTSSSSSSTATTTDRVCQRVPAVKTASLPGQLPICTLADTFDHASLAASSIPHLNNVHLPNLAADALWRDLYALTGTLRTIYTANTVRAAWAATARRHQPCAFEFVPGSSKILRFGANGENSWVEAWFTFRLPGGRWPADCSGRVGIVPDMAAPGGGRIWMLVTMLERIDAFPDVDMLEPVVGGVEWDETGREGKRMVVEWGLEKGASREPTVVDGVLCFDCVIVGAGFAGLTVASRLKALGLSYVAIDRIDEIGQNWTGRYDAARLHTPREYSTFPFERSYSAEDPYFLSSKDLAGSFQRFVQRFDINVWLSTSVDTASWDEEEKTWTVHTTRKGQQQQQHIKARHLVFALGGGGQVPKMPQYPGRDLFKGTVLHSVEYKSGAEWKDKAGIVIGTANTAHDVAQEMVESGLSSVTMVQRGRTPLVRMEFMHRAFDVFYNPSVPASLADRESLGTPRSISRLEANSVMRGVADEDPSYYESLEACGFRVERYCDLFGELCDRYGGHYIDVGSCDLIRAGKIKMKSDALPVSYTEHGLRFSDGSENDADVIVFCTGFEGNVRTQVAGIVGEEIGETLEDWWHCDPEGEMRGAWKPTGHPAIWYAGGGMSEARFFSRYIALQIKANLAGAPLEVYTENPPDLAWDLRSRL